MCHPPKSPVPAELWIPSPSWWTDYCWFCACPYCSKVHNRVVAHLHSALTVVPSYTFLVFFVRIKKVGPYSYSKCLLQRGLLYPTYCRVLKFDPVFWISLGPPDHLTAGYVGVWCTQETRSCREVWFLHLPHSFNNMGNIYCVSLCQWSLSILRSFWTQERSAPTLFHNLHRATTVCHHLLFKLQSLYWPKLANLAFSLLVPSVSSFVFLSRERPSCVSLFLSSCQVSHFLLFVASPSKSCKLPSGVTHHQDWALTINLRASSLWKDWKMRD